MLQLITVHFLLTSFINSNERRPPPLSEHKHKFVIFTTRILKFYFMNTERTWYQDWEVKEAAQGEEEQSQEDPWCKEGRDTSILFFLFFPNKFLTYVCVRVYNFRH